MTEKSGKRLSIFELDLFGAAAWGQRTAWEARQVMEDEGEDGLRRRGIHPEMLSEEERKLILVEADRVLADLQREIDRLQGESQGE